MKKNNKTLKLLVSIILFFIIFLTTRIILVLLASEFNLTNEFILEYLPIGITVFVSVLVDKYILHIIHT